MELTTLLWVLIALQAIISGGLSMTLAEKKGHSSGAWFAAGFFFGIFGLLAAVGLPARLPLATPELFTKTCPDCSESIRREALVCKYCGRKFNKSDVVADLISGLQDKSIDTRLRALEALRVNRDDSMLPHLVRAFDQAGSEVQNLVDPSIRVMNKAAQLLTEIGGQAVASPLVAILKKGGSTVKSNKVVETLGMLRDPVAALALIEALDRSDLRSAAATALQRIGPVAMPHLESFVKQARGLHRRRAEKVIAEIKSAQSK